MTKNHSLTTLKFLRHGESHGNKGEIFQGGGPDAHHHALDRDRGPTRLTALGKRQALAAGIAASMLGLTVEYISTSQMNRAIHTGVLFAQGYGGNVHVSPERIPDFHEISHGSLEWTVSKNIATNRRRETVARMTAMLLDMGLHPDLKEMAPWVIPTGSGDGESYLAAGMRSLSAIESHPHRENEILVGHNGAMRQARALAMCIPGDDRRRLSTQLSETTTTRALIPVIEALHESGLYPLDYVNDRSKRIGNAETVEVRVDGETGLWTPQQRIKPILPAYENVPLTSANVYAVSRPFTTADEWL